MKKNIQQKLGSIRAVVILSLLLVVFSYGVGVGVYHWPPFSILQGIISKIKIADPIYTEILEQYRLTDVNSLIEVNNSNDVEVVRQKLISVVFGKSQLQKGLLPQSVQNNIVDHDYDDMSSLEHIDILTLDMLYDINSIMYYFHAVDSNSRLAIYHQGHSGGFALGKTTINGLLNRGYDVIAIAMPLKGGNSRPLVKVDGVGIVSLKNHEWMQFLDYPLSFFMNPILSAVQHGLARKNYSDVSLVGLSGGGWAVTLYAALDDRIKNTYQVGGTMPYFLRSPVAGKYNGHMGDFEQRYVPLIQTANYLELYILGSVGQDRKEIQIINQYDSVAAHGIKYKEYESTVRDKVNEISIGGSFRVLLDSNNPHHSISLKTLKFILDDLNATFYDGNISDTANK